jgi:hypothetical protein
MARVESSSRDRHTASARRAFITVHSHPRLAAISSRRITSRTNDKVYSDHDWAPTFSSRTIVVDVPVSRMLVTGAGVDRHTLTASTPHRRLSRAFLESFDTVPRDV